MDRFTRVGFVTILGFCFISGCGDDSSPSASADSSGQAAASSSPAIDEIARSASEFLDAVLKGDIQRASARLTPQAMQRIIDSGIQFRPPGQEQATFRTGEVRTPTKTQALVQFVFSYTAADGSPQSDEGCCLMRQVENDWRVSGIAYAKGPNQRWTLSDFETGQTVPINRQPAVRAADGQPPAAPIAGRPSPPRTAQESGPAAVR